MSQTTVSHVQRTIGLRNVRTQQQTILQRITRFAQSPVEDPYEAQKILKLLSQTVAQVEQVCTQHQLTPANLTELSRQIYSWMKFLLDEHHLLLHIQATRRVQRLVAEVVASNTTPRSKKPTRIVSEKLNVEFLNMAGLYKYKSNSSCTLLQICEGFIVASDQVLNAIVQATLIGKSSASSRVIRTFSLSEEFSEVLLKLDLMVESIIETPQGQVYDLNAIFEAVNLKYFVSQMPKPRLTWNQVLTKRKFGHYEPARDRIVVSRTLDNRQVPQYVVEFVLYHELLHKQHGEKWGKSRLMFHTPEFRADERKFKQYEQAQQWLANLARTK